MGGACLRVEAARGQVFGGKCPLAQFAAEQVTDFLDQVFMPAMSSGRNMSAGSSAG